MNSYNLFSNENPTTILYHAVARDTDHVAELAADYGINVVNLGISLEKSNIKDQLGRPMPPFIKSAIIQ